MSSILKVDQLQDSGGNNLVTSNGSGVITAAGFGKVLQVVENSSSTNFTNSSTSHSELINASITPSSTSNKILIYFAVNCQITANSNAYGRAGVLRGTISGTSLGDFIGGSAASSNVNFPLYGTYLDSPSTTSAQQYTLGMSTASGATTSVTTDSTTYRLVLMEIQA